MSSSCYRVLNEATRAALFLLSAKLELGPLDSAEMVLTSSRTLYSWPVIKAQVGKAVGRVLRGREAFGPCWVGLVGYGKGEGCVWSIFTLHLCQSLTGFLFLYPRESTTHKMLLTISSISFFLLPFCPPTWQNPENPVSAKWGRLLPTLNNSHQSQLGVQRGPDIVLYFSG